MPIFRTVPLALALALAFVAGCVAPVAQIESLAAEDPQAVLPHLELSEEHDHQDPAIHDVKWNMELLGWSPGVDDVTKAGEYNQVHVAGDVAFVASQHLENGTAGGLIVYDVSGDAPVVLSKLETPELTPIDVHSTPDGRFVVLGGHRENRVSLPEQVSTQCTGDQRLRICAPYVPAGVVVVDASDPKAPVVLDSWRSFPSGAHTAKIVEIAGEPHVFIASYGTAYANRVGSHVEILKLQGGRLVPVSEFFSSRPSDNGNTERVFVHDMFVEEHPLTGQMLMWVAYWDGGVLVVDVSNPSAPRQLAAWTDFEGVEYGNIHFARPVGMIGERYIVYAAPEMESAAHAGEAYILDATDPEAPTLITKWVLPGNPVNDGHYRFSPHNHEPLGERLVYAHYHGGVWVLDLSTPEEPRVDGYVFPVVPAGTEGFVLRRDAPDVWAAAWKADGTILASDRGQGLFHYRLVSDEPGTPPYEALLS